MCSDIERPIRVLFLSFPSQGHLIPMLDMARLFASQGVHCTIVTTPLNSTRISKPVAKSLALGHNIDIETITFPATEVGLPEGCENADMLTSPELIFKFFEATDLLQMPFEKLLELKRPDCLVSDLFFPWSVDSAKKMNIPRINFHGTSFFAMCSNHNLKKYMPYKKVSSDAEEFCIPDFPDEIRITRSQLPMETWENEEKGIRNVFTNAEEAGARSYGIVVNSFVELEPGYVDYYKNVMGMKAWCVGPVSLCNRNIEEKGMRGKESAIEDDQCLKWLDGKEMDSVVYVCFGSNVHLSDTQLHDIALGLELSGKNFVWVIRRGSDSGAEDYLPAGYEVRIKDRGLIIRGWAPQVLILDHPSVGAFVTHCGWNSTLEGITAGLPLVTWPLFADQFFNEKLVTNVLKIGVGVGCKKWGRNGETHIHKENIEKAVNLIMEGVGAIERRARARELGKLAKQAVEKDGSSYNDIHNLLDDLRSMRNSSGMDG